jgi:hypothetical protein
VSAVLENWRANSSDPDVGSNLPAWLEDFGFKIKDLRPIIEFVAPSDPLWQWLKAFIDTSSAVWPILAISRRPA